MNRSDIVRNFIENELDNLGGFDFCEADEERGSGHVAFTIALDDIDTGAIRTFAIIIQEDV